MPATLRVTITTSVTVLALVAAGCGSGDQPDVKAAFKTAYTAQSLKIKAVGEGVGVAIAGASAQTDAQVVATFGMLAARAHESAEALRSLKAPDDSVKADVADLRASLSRAANDLDAIVAAAQAGNAAAAAKASQALVVDSAPIRDARAAVDSDVAK